MTNLEVLDDTEKCRIECLLDQLGLESPIRPMKGFRLDFSTILGLFGLMTTYTIVLLQFKMDDSQQCSHSP